jgi:hypothetical protein
MHIYNIYSILCNHSFLFLSSLWGKWRGGVIGDGDKVKEEINRNHGEGVLIFLTKG